MTVAHFWRARWCLRVSFFEKHKEGFKHLQTLQCNGCNGIVDKNPSIIQFFSSNTSHHTSCGVNISYCGETWWNLSSVHLCHSIHHPGSIPDTNWVVKSPLPKKTWKSHLVGDWPTPKTISSSVGMMTFPARRSSWSERPFLATSMAKSTFSRWEKRDPPTTVIAWVSLRIIKVLLLEKVEISILQWLVLKKWPLAIHIQRS